MSGLDYIYHRVLAMPLQSPNKRLRATTNVCYLIYYSFIVRMCNRNLKQQKKLLATLNKQMSRLIILHSPIFQVILFINHFYQEYVSTNP